MRPLAFRIVLTLVLVNALAFAAQTTDRHYLKTYEESRDAFRALAEQAKKKFREVEHDHVKVPSPTEKDLVMDSLHIPAQKKAKGLVVLVSGVHGAEAFAASAVQRMLFEDVLLAGKVDTEETGYLFLHAVNPWGFRHFRRVTENNVDLNRNFGVDKNHFSKKNEVYRKVDHLINPKGKANASWIAHAGFLVKAMAKLLEIPQDELSQGILGGVWEKEFNEGVYFGGLDFEPQNDLVGKELLRHSDKYSKVMILDFHTGYGERGFMHLLPNPPDTKEIGERWKTVFGKYRIESTEGDDFYTNDGDFPTYASRLLEAKKKTTVPMLIEYGTLDSQDLKGSIASLSRTVLENQLHFHGAVNERSEKIIRHNYQEFFYPSAKDWRKKVMDQTEKHVPVFIQNFTKLLQPKVAER